RLGRAHHVAAPGRPDRAETGHDLSFHDRAVDGGLGLRDHGIHCHHRTRAGTLVQYPAPDAGEIMSVNPIQPTIPLDGQGKQHGFLRLPYSRNDSAWGSVMIPVTVIANGQGPTALLTGGNHGDEYEGPIALQQLAWEIEP